MRQVYNFLLGPGQAWPESAGGRSVAPFRWIRVHNRVPLGAAAGAAVVASVDGAVANDPLRYWDIFLPGERRVRNLRQEHDDGPAGELHFLNIDPVLSAVLRVETELDGSIVDITAPAGSGGAGAPPQLTRLEDGASGQLALVDGTGALRVSPGAGVDVPNNRLIAAPPLGWSLVHLPAIGAVATVTAPSGGAGVRNVARTVIVGMYAAPGGAQTGIYWTLADGVSGNLIGGIISALAGQSIVVVTSGLFLPGTPAAVMTLAFTSAPGPGTYLTAALEYVHA